MEHTDFTAPEESVGKTSDMRDEHQIIKITEKTPVLPGIGRIVCGDTNSNMLTFEINRYYDNVDLSTKTIRIIVKNELGMFTENAVNVQYTDELLRFSWILSDSVTYKSGTVSAAIAFVGTEAEQNYALKTVPFHLNIDGSLELMELQSQHKNWFSQVECRLLKLEADTAVATPSTNGLLSAEDKAKLDGIAADATKNSPSSTAPKGNGTANAGAETDNARGDHVHPLQTSVSGNAGTATRWESARNINGLSVQGDADRANYGVCSTEAAAAAKTVSCSGFSLTTGAEITVKFALTNTAAKPTLNVNDTGAKPVCYRGRAVHANCLAAEHTYTFRYDGTQWDLVGDLDTDTTSPVMTGARADAAGNIGLVPAPAAGDQNKFLRGDGSWQIPPVDSATIRKIEVVTALPADAANHPDTLYLVT